LQFCLHLYKNNKFLESLSKYEIVIYRRFEKYKDLEVKWFPKSNRALIGEEDDTVSKPIDPSYTMMFNINTNDDGTGPIYSDEEKDTIEISPIKGEHKQNQIDKSDDIFLTKVIKEFNVKAMLFFNSGDMDKAEKLLK